MKVKNAGVIMIRKIKKEGYNLKEKIKAKKRSRHLKKSVHNFDLTDIVKDLKSIGVKRGDHVIVHSSLKNVGYVKGGAKTIIKALLNVLGKEGTLVLPANPLRGGVLNACKSGNYIFDYKKDKATTGAIPNALLNMKGTYRSIHPTHSVVAIGKYAKQITEKHHIGNRTYGENSPWAKLIELNGKILGLGVTLAWSTQYHHLEDIMGDKFPVKVKVDEVYKLKCKMGRNKYIEVEVQPNDPNVYKTRIEKNPFILEYFNEIYGRSGILNIGKIGDADSWLVNMKEFINILKKLANIGITIYSTEEYLKKNNLFPFELIKDRL